MAHDLPRETGTRYAIKSPKGLYWPVEYMEAYTAWKSGRDVYVKNVNHSVTRAEYHALPWESVDPPA